MYAIWICGVSITSPHLGPGAQARSAEMRFRPGGLNLISADLACATSQWQIMS